MDEFDETDELEASRNVLGMVIELLALAGPDFREALVRRIEAMAENLEHSRPAESEALRDILRELRMGPPHKDTGSAPPVQ